MELALLRNLLTETEIENMKRKTYIFEKKLLDTHVKDLTWFELAQIWLILEHHSNILPDGVFVANCANELHKRILDKGFLIY